MLFVSGFTGDRVSLPLPNVLHYNIDGYLPQFSIETNDTGQGIMSIVIKATLAFYRYTTNASYYLLLTLYRHTEGQGEKKIKSIQLALYYG